MKHEKHGSATAIQQCTARGTQSDSDRRRRLLIIGLIIVTALSVRFLNRYGRQAEIVGVQTSVALNYKQLAGLIRANGIASLYQPNSPTSTPDLLGHPPGYPLLLSFIYRVSESDATTQSVQILLDGLSAVMICLIALELFPVGVALITGLLAAFAPQFSWNSILLLPDSLATLPILVAVLIVIRNRKANDHSRLVWMLIAGALIGISCWLRANALLLAPFLALFFPLIFKPGSRFRPALLLIIGMLLVIAPVTIRNAMVFGKFIPLSLGAGQTFIEGIADYDTSGTLGMQQTDVDLTQSEAKTLQRPDYATSLFNPDGPARDRARLARGLSVVRAHPVWFAGVMLRRAASMLRLERTPLRLPSAATESSVQMFQWSLRIIQKIFITAIFLPLTLLGAAILVYERRFETLTLLLLVPAYYFCIQSALHTEYRYVLVIHYFLFTFAALAIHTGACALRNAFANLR